MSDSQQSLAMPQTPKPSGKALCSERQWAVSGNTLDHSAIREGPHWWEIASSQWQCLRPLNYQDRPSVVVNSEQSVAMPQTTRPSRQVLRDERQCAVSGKALDHTTIRAGTQWWETVSSQWQRLKPLGHQGRPSSGERQRAVSGKAFGHTTIRAGTQWWETVSGQWQRLKPLGHQGRLSVVRDSMQSVAMP